MQILVRSLPLALLAGPAAAAILTVGPAGQYQGSPTRSPPRNRAT